MEFTFEAYIKLIDLLKKHNYSFIDYSDFERQDKSVILRHDVDYDLHRVLKMAELEKEQGVSSTYFVLATSDFYNIMSKESQEILHKQGTASVCILMKNGMILRKKTGTAIKSRN